MTTRSKHFEKLVERLVNDGWSAAAAINIASAVESVNEKEQERDSHGRFAGSGGSDEPSSSKPRDGSNGRKPPSGEITTEGEKPLKVEEEGEDTQDQTEVKPGDSMDNGRKPSSGTYGRPDKKPKS